MEQNNAYNGIRIIDSMNLSVPKSRRILNIIPLVLITFSGICGTIVSFSSMFGISMTFKVKLAFMLTFAAFIILFEKVSACGASCNFAVCSYALP